MMHFLIVLYIIISGLALAGGWFYLFFTLAKTQDSIAREMNADMNALEIDFFDRRRKKVRVRKNYSTALLYIAIGGALILMVIPGRLCDWLQVKGVFY